MWQKVLDHMLAAVMREGTLVLHLPDGSVSRYGDGGPPEVTVRITDPELIPRLARNPDLAAGEGYMDGTLTIDGDDLHGLLELSMRNILAHRRVWWQRPVEWARIGRRWLDQANPVSSSRRNVAHHYDLSGELYELFLDTDRQYSCAYFRSPGDTLEQAQAQKKAHIARKLLIEPGMRVLDIGCGWGGMALTLARDHGARVLGITLSQEQHRVATQRAAEAGLSDRVEFRLLDYRNVTGQFDRIVSVGMFEHVGRPNFRKYFRTIRDRLTPDGVALIHTIGRITPPGATNPWIARYIFPGGYIPAASETLRAIEAQDLWATDVESWRLHYAMTLRHWLERFDASAVRVRAMYDERFIRMWRFYLIASEQSFRFGGMIVFQFQLARNVDAVPLTRDYLYREGASASGPALLRAAPALKQAAE